MDSFIYENILLRLPFEKILECRTVCKMFNEIINDNLFWKYMCEKDMDDEEITTFDSDDEYYNKYKRWYNIKKFGQCYRPGIRKNRRNNLYRPANLYKINEIQIRTTFEKDINEGLTGKTLIVRSRLESIPKSLTYFNLTILDLSYNEIETIDDNVSRLKKLRGLYMKNNKIKMISDGLCQLTTLRVLRLECNDIREIPESIKKLKNLTYLGLGLQLVA